MSERPAPRYVVAGGGTPTAEELAAITIALTPVAVPTAPDERASRRPGGWARAARHEAVGGRQAVDAADVVDLPW